MVHRSGETLYSSWVGDNPRTCSATICVVISKCTSRCSRSASVMGAAYRGAANRHAVSVRAASGKPRGVFLRGVFKAMDMLQPPFLGLYPLDGERRVRSSGGRVRMTFCSLTSGDCTHPPESAVL